MQSDKIATPAKKAATPTTKKGSAKSPETKAETTNEKAPAKKTAKKQPAKKAAVAAKPKTKAAGKKPTKATSTKTKSNGLLTIRFEIFFSTKFGESILISGAHPKLGSENTSDAPVMTYIDDQKWAIELTLEKDTIQKGQISYTYLVRYDNGALTLSAPYQLQIPAAATSITVRDSWNAPGFKQNALLSDAMQAIHTSSDTPKSASKTKKKFTHRFIIAAPALEPGKAICLSGQAAELGGWEAKKAILLENQQGGHWQADLTLKSAATPSPYKYGIYDLHTGQLESFEAGENRTLFEDQAGAALIIQQDGFLRTH